VRSGSVGVCRIELDFDRYASSLVTMDPRIASATLASDPHLHPAPIYEVAPPALPLWPPDVDAYPIPVLVVADRQCVAATGATSRDRDQRQITTQHRMKRRAEHGLHDGIGGAVEHRERRMTLPHRRDRIALRRSSRAGDDIDGGDPCFDRRGYARCTRGMIA